MTRLTIGQLARAAGVPTSTVRYYERRKLLRPLARSAGDYRVFDENALARLRLIARAKSAGFTLADIALFVRLGDQADSPIRQVQDLIRTRLNVVARELDELTRIRGMLEGWLTACRDSEHTGRCCVLAELTADV